MNRSIADHPRIRGEHPPHRGDKVHLRGSSPHTRGALLRHQHVERRQGIIPAYAGSTSRPSRSASPPSDHPRIRGEHTCPGCTRRMLCGSSPHTRGARRRRIRLPRRARIIPAYAGSTRRASSGMGLGSDHPRIRGEHPGVNRNGRGPAGSSPHTRGALPFFFS